MAEIPKLKRFRSFLDLSQEEMAQRVAKTQSMWAKYERGESDPSADVRRVLAELGLNLNWLDADIGPMLLGDTSWTPPPSDAHAISLEDSQVALRLIEDANGGPLVYLSPEEKGELIWLVQERVAWHRAGGLPMPQLKSWVESLVGAAGRRGLPSPGGSPQTPGS